MAPRRDQVVRQTVQECTENDRLAHEFLALKQQGLIVGRILVNAVKATKLMRDRSSAVDPELSELIASISQVA